MEAQWFPMTREVDGILLVNYLEKSASITAE
jgi:hypothetical protein